MTDWLLATGSPARRSCAGHVLHLAGIDQKDLQAALLRLQRLMSKGCLRALENCGAFGDHTEVDACDDIGALAATRNAHHTKA